MYTHLALSRLISPYLTLSHLISPYLTPQAGRLTSQAGHLISQAGRLTPQAGRGEVLWCGHMLAHLATSRSRRNYPRVTPLGLSIR